MIHRRNFSRSQVEQRKRTEETERMNVDRCSSSSSYIMVTVIGIEKESMSLPFDEKRNNLTFTLVLNQIANRGAKRV